jgi:hypothetical protein
MIYDLVSVRPVVVVEYELVVVWIARLLGKLAFGRRIVPISDFIFPLAVSAISF